MELITRTVSVNRTRMNKDALVATGRVLLSVNDEMVVTMPRCEGDFTATFVNLGCNPAADRLDSELAKLGWELIADPVGLAALNEQDPAFANGDQYPNATQWKGADGKYCYVLFERWCGRPSLSVDRHSDYWSNYWWFPCRRKN